MKFLLKKTRLFTLILAVTLLAKINVVAQVAVQIDIAPPVMPVYEQPVCPVDGYIWTPGYWAYGDGGYYWVDGMWLYPAQSNFLWTPGYWNYDGGYYGWNAGYWGPHIGYYGGVCYGYGYDGEGYSGGRWEGGSFRYNTAVSNVNANVVRNTYAEKVEVRNSSRASFNGPGGLSAKPTSNERLAMNENHIKPTSGQISHEQTAIKNKNKPVLANKTTAAKTETNKTNTPTKNNETRTVNKAPAKVNAVPKQQNNNNVVKQNKATQQYNAPKQQAPVQRSMPKQQQNVSQQRNAPQQQHNTAQQQSAPQQQQSAPQQQHAQAPRGGGGRR